MNDDLGKPILNDEKPSLYLNDNLNINNDSNCVKTEHNDVDKMSRDNNYDGQGIALTNTSTLEDGDTNLSSNINTVTLDSLPNAKNMESNKDMGNNESSFNDKKLKNAKIFKKENIPTIIVGVITFLLVIKTFRGFYYGFKYYDIAHPEYSAKIEDIIPKQEE